MRPYDGRTFRRLSVQAWRCAAYASLVHKPAHERQQDGSSRTTLSRCAIRAARSAAMASVLNAGGTGSAVSDTAAARDDWRSSSASTAAGGVRMRLPKRRKGSSPHGEHGPDLPVEQRSMGDAGRTLTLPLRPTWHDRS